MLAFSGLSDAEQCVYDRGLRWGDYSAPPGPLLVDPPPIYNPILPPLSAVVLDFQSLGPGFLRRYKANEINRTEVISQFSSCSCVYDE